MYMTGHALSLLLGGEDVKRVMCLLQEVLLDRGTWCGVDTTLDLKKIQGRVEHEGLSFLTITLPAYGKVIEKSLDRGALDRKAFAFSSRSKQMPGLPALLGGFLCLVFDSNTGRLLDEPSPDAIQALRQITLMWAKMSADTTLAREQYTLRQFLKCEQEVRAADARRTEGDISSFKRLATLLWSDVLQRVDEDIAYGRIVPKHGPGTTAESITGNRKYQQREWTERLEKVFPSVDHLLPSPSYYHELGHVDLLEPGQERPVRVVTVPKTLKAPRIIAIEPLCMQYAQQGILESLVGHLEGRDNPFNWLVGFQDQSPNRRMALEGSLYGKLATLDLSEASDRVSNQHVRDLLRNHPHVAEGVDACRSRKADVLGKTYRLAKFASMGSALCFPFEAMVFATIIFVGIERALNRRLTRRDLMSFHRQVRVYGDDIIVPVDYAEQVVEALEDFGLRVNTSKSFWTGRFRESCGREYYDGHDVSIVRIRSMIPSQPGDAPALVSTVSLRNQMYFAGYWRVCRLLDAWIEELIPFPHVMPESAVLGRHSVLVPYETQRNDARLHSPLVRGRVVTTEIPPSYLEDYGALLKWFLKRGVEPFADKKHLERSGRARSVRTATRWVCPF
nr:MAG: RNA dependent RNA polymerase [Leviviridae sp.]